MFSLSAPFRCLYNAESTPGFSHAFTLIETLVAASIFALILTSLSRFYLSPLSLSPDYDHHPYYMAESLSLDLGSLSSEIEELHTGSDITEYILTVSGAEGLRRVTWRLDRESTRAIRISPDGRTREFRNIANLRIIPETIDSCRLYRVHIDAELRDLSLVSKPVPLVSLERARGWWNPETIASVQE